MVVMTINVASLPSYAEQQPVMDPDAPIDVKLVQDAEFRRSVAQKVVKVTSMILKVLLALIVLGSIVAGVVCSVVFATPIYAVGIIVCWTAMLLPCLAPSLIRKLYPVQ